MIREEDADARETLVRLAKLGDSTFLVVGTTWIRADQIEGVWAAAEGGVQIALEGDEGEAWTFGGDEAEQLLDFLAELPNLDPWEAT